MEGGWVDGLVQLRSIPVSQWAAFESVLLDQGVTHLVSGGYHPSRDHASRFSGPTLERVQIIEASGLHPMADQSWDFDVWLEAVRVSDTRLIGEVGFDKRCLERVPWREQYARAEAALEIAVQRNAPMIWHSVHATEQTLAFIKTAGQRGVRGVWHGFQGSIETAKRVCLHDWMIGLGPTLMLERSRKLAQVAELLDLECLVIESDWPQKFGGYGLRALGDFLAKMRKISPQKLRNQLFLNFFKLIEAH